MRAQRWCFLASTTILLGCGDDNQAQKDAPTTHDTTPMPDAKAVLGPAPDLAIPCTDALADVYTLPTGLPTMDDTHRGDVFRCAKTESLTHIDVNAQIAAYDAGYTNISPGTATSGFWTYRVAYRTERNTVAAARAEGDTAATLIIPEHPLAGAPLVVFGHGSVGIAASCAPTHLDLSAAVQDQDFPENLYWLAGAGYTVIAPDYAGFSYGQPPGYFNAEDEAHAILDATRAAKQLLPTMPPKVVFTGHSQGGHAALSAQTFVKTYGMEGTLVGVAVWAPLWTSMAIWAAATTETTTGPTAHPGADLMTATDSSAILYAMEYAYSAGELRDGAGHGTDVFQTAKQAAAKSTLLDGACYDTTALSALGTKPADFFDPHYVEVVGYTCAANPSFDCSDTEAAKWKERWISDRPPIDTDGAPILVFYGAKDTSVTPGRAKCAINKISSDLQADATPTTTVRYCYDTAAAHRDIIRGTSPDYVNRWIAAQAGIGADPGACMDFPTIQGCAISPNNF